MAHHLLIYEFNVTDQYQGRLTTKGFNLPPIMAQSLPHCDSTRRTTFLKWRSKIIWGRRNRWSWRMVNFPLWCNIKRRTKLINRWRKNSGSQHQLRQVKLYFLFDVSFPCTIFFSIPYLRTWRLLKSNNLGNGWHIFLHGLFTPSTSSI